MGVKQVYVKIDWLESADDLQARYRAEHDPHVRTRLHALWLLRLGTRTIDAVAAIVGVNPSSVKSWVNWYRTGGLAEVTAHHLGQAGGVVAKISLEDQAILASEAADGTFRSIDEVRVWLKEYCDLDYSYWGTRSLLDRLKIHAKVPRPVNPKTDRAAQEAWKKGA